MTALTAQAAVLYETHPSHCRIPATGRVCTRSVDMWTTCTYHFRMSKMIQLRHVPEDLHRKLKARAALAGLSLSDYLIQEVRRVAERPTVAELVSRLARRTPVTPKVPPAKAVRAERDSR